MTQNEKKDNKYVTSFIAIIVGWVLTLGSLIWTTASTNANYSMRIEKIENEVVDIEDRLDDTESYRMQLASDLAEIKTDLLWIRKELERGN
tara:strand:+ start:370 stop:642 length:273 start_codon:yes stop_codon:yes gene_type:complete